MTTEHYIYETLESLPAKTIITVTSCLNCPFRHVIDETWESCTHPEVTPDEPDMDRPAKTITNYMRTDCYTKPPTWCPMRDLVSTTTIKLQDNV